MSDLDLKFLGFLAQSRANQDLERSLYSPHIWKTSWARDWQDRLGALIRMLDERPDTRALLQLNIFSACLLRNSAVPRDALDFLVEGGFLPFGGKWLDPGAAATGRWSAFPVPIGFSGSGQIRYFLAGLLPGLPNECTWPDWAGGILSGEARDAVEQAARLRRGLTPGRGVFVFPLVGPGHAPIDGRSIGLPAALAFARLTEGEPFPEPVCATGELLADGRVGAVALVPEKVKEAVRSKFRLFLYPHANPAPCCPELETLPVQTVDEALLFTRLYSPGKGRELLELSGMRSDPCAFVLGMDRIDPHWVAWVGREHGWDETIDAVFGSGFLFRIFARNLQNMTADYRLEPASAFLHLVDPGKLTRAGQRSPVAVLVVCTAGVALSNHLGDIAAAAGWGDLGETFLPAARAADLDACADFLNNRMVLAHNRYRFEPALAPEIEELLGTLRRRRAVLVEAGCRIDRKLGELLGTIAQNCAFCGPAHHAEFLQRLEEAQEAFGRDGFADTLADFQRLAGYAVYAHLDAGLRDPARQALSLYTGAADFEAILEKVKGQGLSPWQHASVARFLASPGDKASAEAYLELVRDHPPQAKRDEHPWQLWVCNIGRIALGLGRSDGAERAFVESLRICRLPKLGPTVRLMALQPLSGLHQLGRLPAEAEDTIAAEIRVAAGAIDSPVFNALLGRPMAGVLEAVWAQPEVFFPFTYR